MAAKEQTHKHKVTKDVALKGPAESLVAKYSDCLQFVTRVCYCVHEVDKAAFDGRWPVNACPWCGAGV